VAPLLVVYLDSIDEGLLDYLDDQEDLRGDVVERVGHYATALLDASLSPTALMEDWEDWFDLVGAFVAVYAPDILQRLAEQSPLIGGEELPERLGESDRVFLRELVRLIDMYPEIRQDS
jgi:hypothetical protein